MQRADDATIVGHFDRKSENEQKSELAKAISIQQQNQNHGKQKRQIILNFHQ